jgi:molybdopterin converting factor small subunit
LWGGHSCPPYTLNPAGFFGHPLSMTKINIPTPLRQYAGKQPTVEVKAGTVSEALSGLVSKHPDLRRHLYTDDGKLRSFVNVYLNDEDVRYLQKEATALKDNDTISIVPSIAGGR